jgi:hypothetical protein
MIDPRTPHRSRGLRPLALLLGCLLLVAGSASAQRQHGGAPPSARRALALERRAPASVRLRAVDAPALLREDLRRPKGEPFRFGDGIEVDLSLANAGTWEELEDGGRVWRLRVSSPGAYSLSLLFARFQLPVGGELFVYDDARTAVLGAFTYLNHNANGRFAIQPVRGDALTLEYFEPADARGRSEIAIDGVVHDYRDVFRYLGSGKSGGTSGLGSCHTDVNCPAGDPYRDQADATVQIIIGIRVCSGVLLNNTALDGKQYLLSAEHCRDMTNAVFRFQNEIDGCGTGQVPYDLTLQGSTQKAVDATNDLRLVEINDPIPIEFEPYLAGWDRSDVVPASTFGIHHPGGAPKKICFDADAPVVSGNQWHVLAWDSGTTEGGSSGSGLFDPAGRVIGSLCCGSASCSSPLDDFYQRLSQQWPFLAPFLDPLGSGMLTLDGLDPAPGPPEALTIRRVDPPAIPSLLPGIEHDVTITGTGMDQTTSLVYAGIEIEPASFTRVSRQQLSFDPPQLPFVGPVDVELTRGFDGATARTTVDVVPPPTLALQAHTGNPFDSPSAAVGTTLLLGGQPGDVVMLFYSTSPIPSVHPLITLDFGNQFMEVFEAPGMYVIPPIGWLTVPVNPNPALAFVTTYGQGVCLSCGLPFQVSNLQSAFWIP